MVQQQLKEKKQQLKELENEIRVLTFLSENPNKKFTAKQVTDHINKEMELEKAEIYCISECDAALKKIFSIFINRLEH